MAALVRPLKPTVFEEAVGVFDPDTQQAMKLPAEKRTPMQQQLARLAGKEVNRSMARMHRRLPQPQKDRYYALMDELAKFDAIKPVPLPTAMAVSDVGPEPPATHRLATGNYLKPREVVAPAFPEVLEQRPPDFPPGKPGSTGRRSALARWLTRPDHPLTGRVIVNRLWHHHFGAGIVATPNDFGVMGAGASHPELLDWLAAELVGRGWGLKAIHRLIVTSAAYRQTSDERLNPTAARAAQADPDNHLLWHARSRRRDAESLRDCLLQLSGRLNLRMYGPSAQPELPHAVAETRYSWDPDERPADRNRRSVYVLARRNLPYPLFAAFDLPDRNLSCPNRAVTITAPQALVMLNGELPLAEARHTAGRLLVAADNDPDKLVLLAYQAAFNRRPGPEEEEAAEEFLEDQAELIAAAGPPAREELPEGMPAGTEPAFAAAAVDLCHALMNAAEFLTID
jgi:hypothetical protein